MNLDIDHLRTFVTVAETQSFSKASGVRHRVQSTVSWQMRKLESQLDAKLFKRHRSGVTLTEQGEMLLIHAKKLLDLNDGTCDIFNKTRKNKSIPESVFSHAAFSMIR